ncbi:hypothetical protein NXH76_00530 [Blautia schinkii]|nr:hypothetical protein [Blautia schinkii]
MVMKFLYVVAVFLETAIGIWIFGKMFPKRKCMEKRQYLSEALLLACIVQGSYSYTVFFYYISAKQQLLSVLVGLYFGILLTYFIHKTAKKTWYKIESKIIEAILFAGTIIWLGCQYWTSYNSGVAIMLGNALPVLFIYTFFKCTFSDAYVWELLYLSNIGLLKMVYISYVGAFRKQRYEDFLYPPRVHTYSEILYWFAILAFILISVSYIHVDRVLGKILKEYRKQLSLVAVLEFAAVLVLMKFGIGEIKKEDLSVTLIIVVLIMISLLFVVIRLLGEAIDAEINLLDVRNEAMDCQYRELRESYDKYRCLIHDEKHMIFYLLECLDNGKIQEGRSFLANYQDNIVNTENHSWTGIVTLDFVLNIKMRKLRGGGQI